MATSARPLITSARPLITVEQRRARLLRRHHLAVDAPSPSVVDLTADLVALHATSPATVHLSAWARIPGFTPTDLEQAMYADRTLVRQLCMRRTMFVLDRATHAAAVGAVGPRVTASERTNMLRDLRRSDGFDDPDAWIDTARAAVSTALADGTLASVQQLRTLAPSIVATATPVGGGPGGASSMGPRLLNMMYAAGDIVRGPNTAAWNVSRHLWSAMTPWLGAPLPAISVADGHTAMVRRWLARFGPGTETDIVWWLGSTKAAVRAALGALDVVEVDVELDPGTRETAVGYVLADDVETVESVEAQGFLLPELDPTTMGWKQRDFYIGGHRAAVFDSNGNGGPTVWWDGRVVGGWHTHADGVVRIHLLERLGRRAQKILQSRADELSAWLGEVRVRSSFPAPFQKGLTVQDAEKRS